MLIAFSNYISVTCQSSRKADQLNRTSFGLQCVSETYLYSNHGKQLGRRFLVIIGNSKEPVRTDRNGFRISYPHIYIRTYVVFAELPTPRHRYIRVEYLNSITKKAPPRGVPLHPRLLRKGCITTQFLHIIKTLGCTSRLGVARNTKRMLI